ncbi:MAG: sugar ABC transporter ATP-binding protein [Mesorhizobium sp.]|nr:MAG: sugar ABC transporter ATP-binding protein [Mesorhizobium sp.]
MDDVILSLEGVGKIFPGVVALSDVSLSIARGETHIVLGENGAGKSTLIKLLAGIYQPDSGAIAFNGKPYQPRTPHDAHQSGIRIVHQELNLLPYLSIAENLMLENLPRRAFGVVDRRALNRRAVALLKEVGLDIDPRTRVEALGVAQMQLVEIAKALSYDSKLLVLDEPTATLTPPEIERLFSIIKRLKAKGVTIIYISHRLHEVERVADRVVVLRDGMLAGTLPKSEINHDQMVKLMIGRMLKEREKAAEAGRAPGGVALSANAVRTAAYPDHPVSLDLRRGEILGLAGLVGSGRTELARVLFGIDERLGGSVALGGKALDVGSAADAVASGIFLVPEDRKEQGVVLEQTIGENLAIGNFDHVAPKGWVFPRAVQRFAEAGISRLGVKGRPNQAVGKLSGGNQQKVIIAKWVSRPPKVFILDEPTRGIDVGARAAIYDVIADLARSGMAVVVVSSDLEEVLGLSHRVLVLSRGRQRGILDRDEASNIAVMELATS